MQLKQKITPFLGFNDQAEEAAIRIWGWVMTGLLSAFLTLASASRKFIDFEGKAEI